MYYFGRCWLFRAWGRVGTTIGGNKTEKFGSRKSAMDAFLALYGEKTGNPWGNKKNFTKHPNKFYPLELDFGGVSRNLHDEIVKSIL